MVNEICRTLKDALKDEKQAPNIYYKLVRLGVDQSKMASIVKDETRHFVVLKKLISQYKCTRKASRKK